MKILEHFAKVQKEKKKEKKRKMKKRSGFATSAFKNMSLAA